MNKNISQWSVVISLFVLTISLFVLWNVIGIQQEIKNTSASLSDSSILSSSLPKRSENLIINTSESIEKVALPISEQVFLVDERRQVISPQGVAVPPLPFFIPITSTPGGPATTTQFVARAGVQDISRITPSDVITVYSGDVLLYSNATLGFYFGLPSDSKTLRLDDTGTYARKDNAFLWLWFKRNYDVGIANFFITPTTTRTIDELSFDYNFKGYPKYTAMLSSTTTTVGSLPALEVVVSYESTSPGYLNTWKFIHVIHDRKLYTFGVQTEPSQTINYQYAEKLVSVFKNTFHFVD